MTENKNEMFIGRWKQELIQVCSRTPTLNTLISYMMVQTLKKK